MNSVSATVYPQSYHFMGALLCQKLSSTDPGGNEAWAYLGKFSYISLSSSDSSIFHSVRANCITFCKS